MGEGGEIDKRSCWEARQAQPQNNSKGSCRNCSPVQNFKHHPRFNTGSIPSVCSCIILYSYGVLPNN